MRITPILIIFFTSMVLLLSACSSSPQAGAASPPDNVIQVVATTGMIADVAQNVGRDRVSVVGLMGPGVDPHLYKASEGDVRRLEQADVIFYNGLHLEAGLSGVLERMGDQRTVVAVTSGIERSQLITPPEFSGAYDPHVWFNLSLWMKTVDVVRDTFIELDPEGASEYRENAASFQAELETTHRYIESRAAELSQEQRILITAHDAFNYFGRAYGFEVRGLQGISTASEIGASDVQSLADYIVEKQIRAIFIESSVPQRNVEALQAAVKSRGFDVAIGGQLYSDALGDPGTPAGSYIGMVRHNIDTIVSALKGETEQ